MDARLKVRRVAHEGGTLLRLDGVLDESFDRQQLVEHAQDVVVIDLDGVHRITSFGVREWMTALDEMSARYVAFIHCRPCMVSQFNMVAGFGRSGEVVSFYAPYICPKCNKEIEHLMDLRHDYKAASEGKPPEVLCPGCNVSAEFDDIAETYFSFVATRPQPNVPALAERLIDGEFAQTEQHLRVQKEVQGVVTALRLVGPLDEKAKLKRLLEGLEGYVIVLASELTEASQAGLERFGAFVQKGNTEVYLAQVPTPLVRAFASHEATKNVPILSMLASLRCIRCNAINSIELDIQNTHEIAEQSSIHHHCKQCNEPIRTTALPPEILNAARTVITLRPPEEVARYLRSLQSSGGVDRFSVRSIASGPMDSSSSDTPVRAYDLVRRIGAGGMAEVFLATQHGPQGFQKTIVLKRLLPSLSQDAIFTEMFLQEARLAARISHPNVVQIFDLGKIDDQYCITMEYVPGRNLREILAIASRLLLPVPVEIACRIVADVCAGLHAAHTSTDPKGNPLGIVHRDVSPANILVSTDGAVKITDFGVAKAYQSVSHTRPGELKGKVLYLAPEQVLFPDAPANQRTDVFSIGVVLYEILAGKHPFRKPTEYASLSAIVSEEVPSLSSVRPDIPHEVETLVSHAIARHPNDRYESAAVFHADLEAALVSLRKHITAAHVATWLQNLLTQQTSLHPLASRTPGAISRSVIPSSENSPTASTKVYPVPASVQSKSIEGLQEAQKQLGEAGKRLDRILEKRKSKDSA